MMRCDLRRDALWRNAREITQTHSACQRYEQRALSVQTRSLALYDMLLDLQWIKHEAIELIISSFDSFLSEESPEDKADLLLLLEQVCEGWRDGDFDDEEWEMKKFRVYIIGDSNVEANVNQMIASIREEE